MQEKQLDQRDHKLLALLTGNARIPVADLARKVDLSRTAVRHRIEKLEQHGFIQGYTLKSQPPEKVGVQAIASVTLAHGSVGELRAEIGHLLGIKQVWPVAGNVDAFMLLEADGVDSLYELINSIGKQAVVAKLNSHVVLG